jgi:glycosyltransferase involved in cell wall biosynthesis
MRELGAAGRERVIRDFSWEASAAALESVWESAVSGQSR